MGKKTSAKKRSVSGREYALAIGPTTTRKSRALGRVSIHDWKRKKLQIGRAHV